MQLTIFKRIILLTIIVSSFSIGGRSECNLFLKDCSKAIEKSKLQLSSDSSKFAILYELNFAKNSLISAIVECKPYKKELKKIQSNET